MFSGECGCVPQGGEESNPAGVSVSFSHKVLFYEDGYYDEALGIAVPPWTGERVALGCSVSGGEYGGVFNLSLVNIGKLDWVGGDVLPVGDVSVAAKETRSWRAVYTFASHSDSEDDVQATATFTENLSGEEMTDTDSMTVVMLRVVADEMWPTNKVRRVFGVGETASIYKTPNIETTAVASRGSCAIGRLGISYTSPYEDGVDTVVVAANEVSHPIEFSICEPTGYSVITVKSRAFATEGESGGFKMFFTCRLLPAWVSFAKNIFLREVPCIANDATGYYAQPRKAKLLNHGLHGAGEWNVVAAENIVSDTATMEVNDQPWLGGGSFTWPIPNAWRGKDDNGSGTIFCNTDQRFELDADGTARLKKFYRFGERMTNGVYISGKESSK